MIKNKLEQGQMLLVVVLTMIVALTVGLSVVSRTITNLRISKQNEESQRAFQAAEAGIQKVIEENISGPTTDIGINIGLPNSSSYKIISASNIGGTGSPFLVNGGNPVDQDIGIDVWLSDHSGGGGNTFENPITGDVTVYWGTSDQSCLVPEGPNVAPAMEIVVLSREAGFSLLNPNISKFVYDPCGRIDSAPAPLGVNFTIVQSGQSETFKYAAQISNIDSGIIMKVIPLFGSSIMGISSGVSLPTQGKEIDSIGNSGSTARRVRYFSSFPQIPTEVFPYSIITQ